MSGTATVTTEVCDYEPYTGHRVWEGAHGTNGRAFPFLRCEKGKDDRQASRPAGRPLTSGRHRTGRKGLATATCQCRAVDRAHETQ